MAGLLKFVTLALVAVQVITAAPSKDAHVVPGAFDNGKIFVCYWGTWANYRPGDGKYYIENIDPHLCTHLVYGFFGLRNNEIASLDPYLDLPENWGKGTVVLFNNLKQQNPKLKTIAAIGGWNEGSTTYSAMAASPTARAQFISSVVTLLQKYNFDGLDMDWEYPANRGGSAEDYDNFVTLLKELREEFKNHGLLLTAAVSAGKPTVDTAYNVPEINKYLDIISIMAYDYFGAWNNYVQHNAPLENHPMAEGDYIYFNLRYSVQMWLQKGASASKMALGMPLYGRGYRLDNPSNYGFYAPASNPCTAGPYTREAGFLGYNEICEKQLSSASNGFKRYWDDDVKAPYATFNSNEWIGYDDTESLALKMDLIDEFGLAGGMVWSIETDDFRGKCGPKNPLLTYISTRLNNGITPTGEPDTEAPTTAPPATTAAPTEDPNATEDPGVTSEPGVCVKCTEFQCPGAGNFARGECCESFCQCVANSDGTYEARNQDCGPGLYYNPSGYCDWAYNMPDCSDKLLKNNS